MSPLQVEQIFMLVSKRSDIVKKKKSSNFLPFLTLHQTFLTLNDPGIKINVFENFVG